MAFRLDNNSYFKSNTGYDSQKTNEKNKSIGKNQSLFFNNKENINRNNIKNTDYQNNYFNEMFDDFFDNRGINDGISKYRHDGSNFNFYKKDDTIKGEFIVPYGKDPDEAFKNFIDAFPEVEEDLIEIEDTNSNSSSSCNGIIDETVLQGGTGDCWILTAINALNSSVVGQEIIQNAITVNDDGSATVTFDGVGVSYTITATEIARYDTDDNLDDSYSNGDNDMLVIELACEKLWQDINSHKVTLNSDNEDITYTGNSIDDGGLPLMMIYYLTGIESDEYYSDNLQAGLDEDTIYNILTNAYENSDNTILTFGIYYGSHSAQLTDGSTYTLEVGDGGHALAVTEVTQDTITFTNPWDSSVTYTMSWSEFAKLGVGYISSSDLSSIS